MFEGLKKSYAELKKVTWTPMSELQNLTVVVMVASVIFALVVVAMDFSFENIMGAIYSTLGDFGK